MAEPESASHKPSAPETATSGDDRQVSIALSEEALAALLGPDDVSPKAGSQNARASEPRPIPPSPNVESTLASLAAVQENHAERPQTGEEPVNPAAAQPEHVGSALALIAAIKENRAGMLRSEAIVKPATQPEPVAPAAPVTRPDPIVRSAPRVERTVTPVPSPAAKPAHPARAERTIAPTPTPASLPVPAKGTDLPITERVAPTVAASPERPTRAERQAAIAAQRSAAIPARVPQPGSFETAPPEPSGMNAALDKLPGGRMTLLVIGAVIAVGGISTGLYMRSHRPAKPVVVAAPVPVPPPINNFPLQLQVEPQGNGQINVRWNPQSTLLGQAREGRLVITETNQKPRTIALPLDQLKFGHLTYQSQGERVEFRLEVVDGSGAVAEESVLAVASPAATKPGAATPQQIALANTAAQKTEAIPPQKVEEAPQPSRPAPRAFTPPSVQQTPQQRALVEAPPVLGNGPVAVPLINAQLPAAAAPPPPAPAAGKETPITEPVQVASNLQASKLVTRITPAYPPLAKSAHVQGTVRMQAVVGRDGVVQSIQVLSGPPLLRPAATDAVKRWVYRPTLLNGQAVEVVTMIDVAFTLGQ